MKITFYIFLLIMPFLVSGQNGETGYYNSDSAIVVSEDNKEFNEAEVADFIKEKKTNFHLTAGAFAGTSFGSGEYFGTYVSPEVSYRLSPKFTLSGGATIVNSFGNPYYYPMGEGSMSQPASNQTRTLLFASGSYQLNKRLMISGTVYKEFSMFSHEPTSTRNYSDEYQGMIMGVDYKVGKNIFIQGQIEISNNPYSRHGYPSSSFGRGFGGSGFNQYPPF
jgi:hypothetical protein